jgi:hypothetical protein
MPDYFALHFWGATQLLAYVNSLVVPIAIAFVACVGLVLAIFDGA